MPGVFFASRSARNARAASTSANSPITTRYQIPFSLRSTSTARPGAPSAAPSFWASFAALSRSFVRREVDDVDDRLSGPVGRQEHRRAALRDRCASGRAGRRRLRRSGNGLRRRSCRLRDGQGRSRGHRRGRRTRGKRHFGLLPRGGRALLMISPLKTHSRTAHVRPAPTTRTPTSAMSQPLRLERAGAGAGRSASLNLNSSMAGWASPCSSRVSRPDGVSRGFHCRLVPRGRGRRLEEPLGAGRRRKRLGGGLRNRGRWRERPGGGLIRVPHERDGGCEGDCGVRNRLLRCGQERRARLRRYRRGLGRRGLGAAGSGAAGAAGGGARSTSSSGCGFGAGRLRLRLRSGFDGASIGAEISSGPPLRGMGMIADLKGASSA